MYSPCFDENSRERCHHIIPALIGAAATIGAGAYSAWRASRDNDNNIEAQKEANEQNLAFQRENFDYQKALQKQIFEREDTAYQRTVKDMRAAGMSPLSMNGTNNAGEAISTTAPQVQAVHSDDRSGEIMSQSVAQAFNNVIAASQAQSQTKLLSEQARGLKLENDIKSEFARTDASTQSSIASETLRSLRSQNDFSDSTTQVNLDMLDEQLKSLQDSNRFQSATYDARVKMVKSQLSQSEVSKKISDKELEKISREVAYNNAYGVTDNMDSVEKFIRMLAPALGVDFGGRNGDAFRQLDKDSLRTIMTEIKNNTIDQAKNTARSLLFPEFDTSAFQSVESKFLKKLFGKNKGNDVDHHSDRF